MSFDAPVREGELRSIYREPSQVVVDKVIDHVDAGVREFIERSPLFVLATGDGHQNDASPRGGPPGFVRVLDEHRIAFGDLVGNNRIDSYANLSRHPGVGMLFMIPGLLETLRVNGTATLSVDEELRERCAIDGRVPRVVVGVHVTECFVHCGAALRRAGAWDVSTWPAAQELPSAAAILKTHTALDVPTEAIAENLRSYYDHGIWEIGGDPGT